MRTDWRTSGRAFSLVDAANRWSYSNTTNCMHTELTMNAAERDVDLLIKLVDANLVMSVSSSHVPMAASHRLLPVFERHLGNN